MIAMDFHCHVVFFRFPNDPCQGGSNNGTCYTGYCILNENRKKRLSFTLILGKNAPTEEGPMVDRVLADLAFAAFVSLRELDVIFGLYL